MKTKKFLPVYLCILFVILVFLIFGVFDAFRDIKSGHELCSENGLEFIKHPTRLGVEPTIKCRGNGEFFCFNAKTKESIECVK